MLTNSALLKPEKDIYIRVLPYCALWRILYVVYKFKVINHTLWVSREIGCQYHWYITILYKIQPWASWEIGEKYAVACNENISLSSYSHWKILFLLQGLGLQSIACFIWIIYIRLRIISANVWLTLLVWSCR